MSNVPGGYMQNSLGHLVPLERIAPIDLLRNETVGEIFASAMALQKHVQTEKAWMQQRIKDFLEVSFQEYGVELGGKKRGGLTLSSYDGNIKVQITISDTLVFTEQLQVAKALIDSCVMRWAEGGHPHIKAIVQNSFQVDKEGKINTGRVLSLLRLEDGIDDPEWQQAMKALHKSFTVASSKEYIRISRRSAADEEFEHVVLDFSSL
jgi:hypothetical protein